MYKRIEEVQAALVTRIDQDKLQTRPDGFTYVPWEVTARQLDHVFGPFGWEENITNQQFDTERGIYIVSRRITGYAELPDENGPRYTTITREGVGTGQGDPTNARSTDTAIKAADSDSFSRAAKKLGDAFGLYLYDKSEQTPRTTSTSTSSAPQRTATTSSGPVRPPSAAQMRFLASLGYSDEDVESMAFATWKAILDNKTQKPGTQPRQRRAQVEETADAIPF